MWNRIFELTKKSRRRIAGLMSGTSADGLDVAIVEFEGSGQNIIVKPVAFYALPYSKDFHDSIVKTYNPEVSNVAHVSEMNFRISREHARLLKTLDLSGVDAIGYHGQTVYHLPEKGATLQIGEADVLATELNIPVVGSLRTKDVALGGEGAPIMSYVDWALYGEQKGTITLNIGGISNITYLSPVREEIVAFDTGPGNCLIDDVVAKNFNKTFDKDGEIAKSGEINIDVLSELMERDRAYRLRKPPKTSGREIYNSDFLNGIECEPVNFVRTLVRFTALSLKENLELHLPPVKKIIITGGGAFNPVLVSDIEELCGVEVEIPSKSFIESKEAMGMALLAHEFFNGVPTNMKSVTGASRYAVLGKLSIPD